VDSLQLALAVAVGFAVAAIALGFAMGVLQPRRPAVSIEALLNLRDALEGGAYLSNVEFEAVCTPVTLELRTGARSVRYTLSVLNLTTPSPLPPYFENASRLLVVWGNGRSGGIVSNVLVRESGSGYVVEYANCSRTGKVTKVAIGYGQSQLAGLADTVVVTAPWGTYTYSLGRVAEVEVLARPAP